MMGGQTGLRGGQLEFRHPLGIARDVSGGITLPFLTGAADFLVVKDMEGAGARSVDMLLVGHRTQAGLARAASDIACRNSVYARSKPNNGAGTRSGAGAAVWDEVLLNVA